MSAQDLASAEQSYFDNGVTEVTGVTSPPDKESRVTPKRKSGVPRGNRREISVPEHLRPCFSVVEHDSVCLDSGKHLKPGVWLHKTGKQSGSDPAPLIDQWVSAPVYAEAQTADTAGNNYGRLLRFMTTRGTWRTWAMPMQLLKGSGDDLRGILLDMGLLISPVYRADFGRYLIDSVPDKQMLCTNSLGWCENAFVLANETIGPGAEKIIFQQDIALGDEHRSSGTLEQWKSEIGAVAVGNPLLMLAISAAFAGPLLERCHAESGGIHFVGNSSAGKTTIQKAAVSVWGGPDYRRSWRATSNGLEGVAAMHNDGLLALDEIGECDPREVGQVVYMLGNGQGKQRAGRTGLARQIARWRVVLISTGEHTIAETMLEAGRRQKAGQSVRLLDIPTDRAFGAFDELHHFASGQELADHLQTACAEHYGDPARAFLKTLAGRPNDHSKALAKLRESKHFNTPDMDQQTLRAASRFALYGYAGELATNFGVTGWPPGAALQAAVEGLRSWRASRGTGLSEHRAVATGLSDFVDAHSSARFEVLGKADHTVRDRAGWRDPQEPDRLYFSSGGLREALTGQNFQRALDYLQSAGVLPVAGADGKRAKNKRLNGENARVYEVNVKRLRELVA